MRLGPGPRDWLLLAISVGFTAGGLAIAVGKGDRTGHAAAAFFGGCTLVAVWSIVRKFKIRSHARATSVEVRGGVPLEAGRAFKLTTTLGVAAVGMALLWFGGDMGTVMLVIGAFMALSGGTLAVLVAFDLIPHVFLQFEPEGLRFGQGSYRFLLEWDNIALVAPGEMHGHDMLLIDVREIARLARTVDGAASGGRRLDRFLRWNRRLYDADIAVMPLQFGMDVALMAHALKRYLSDPSARESLRPAPQLTSPP